MAHTSIPDPAPCSPSSAARRPSRRPTLAALLLLGSLLTGCDYMGETIHPGPDPTPPEGIVALWYDDDYQEVGWGGTSDPYAFLPVQFSHELTDPHEVVFPIGAGMDDGGVRSVYMFMHVRVTCQTRWGYQYEDLVDTELASDWAPDRYASSGEIVPDGLWTALAFRPSLYFNECGDDDVVRVEADWTVEVENFSYSDTYFGKGRVFYEP